MVPVNGQKGIWSFPSVRSWVIFAAMVRLTPLMAAKRSAPALPRSCTEVKWGSASALRCHPDAGEFFQHPAEEAVVAGDDLSGRRLIEGVHGVVPIPAGDPPLRQPLAEVKGLAPGVGELDVDPGLDTRGEPRDRAPGALS